MRRVSHDRLRKLNASMAPLESENDAQTQELLDEGATEEDADFVDTASDILTDENGNEFTVDEMVVVQDNDTNEISLFIPDDEEETIPDNVHVVGEVVASDDTVLDSSRKIRASKCLNSETGSTASNKQVWRIIFKNKDYYMDTGSLKDVIKRLKYPEDIIRIENVSSTHKDHGGYIKPTY